MSIRVVLADDHSVVRAGFKMLLEQDSQIQIVGEAADGSQAYAAVARERPAVLLMDISMPPGKSGLVACQEISRDFPETKIIILTMFAESEYLSYTINGGAKGYLLKNTDPAELLEAVSKVAAGGSYIDSRMREQIAASENSSSNNGGGIESLSSRELEILTLLAKGYTNKQVSEEIFISIKTVEAHRSRIYSKLGFKDRSELVAYAIEHKLLQV